MNTTRNTETSAIATSIDSHKIKILVGYTQFGHHEVVYEPNNTKMVSPPNIGVIGTMRTGKTQFARSVIAQFAKEGVNNAMVTGTLLILR